MLNRLFRSITTIIYREPAHYELEFEDEASKDTARKRLQQVLVQDRMGISPDLIDAMKKDLIMAIAKHMRIERDSVDMQVRRNGDSVMLKGNVRLLEAGKS